LHTVIVRLLLLAHFLKATLRTQQHIIIHTIHSRGPTLNFAVACEIDGNFKEMKLLFIRNCTTLRALSKGARNNWNFINTNEKPLNFDPFIAKAIFSLNYVNIHVILCF
jgi:hypothetical protein